MGRRPERALSCNLYSSHQANQGQSPKEGRRPERVLHDLVVELQLQRAEELDELFALEQDGRDAAQSDAVGAAGFVTEQRALP